MLAAHLQNPFGFDRIDLDIGLFGMRLHKETCCIANTNTIRNDELLPRLTFLNLHKMYHYVDEKEQAARNQKKAPEKETKLSKKEEDAVRKAFDAACIRAYKEANEDSSDEEDKQAEIDINEVLKELDKENFARLVTELIVKSNAQGVALDIPSKSDLLDAFDIADEDMSGMVDEEEFMELFLKIKSGTVLRGGFFSGHHRANILARQHVAGHIDGDDVDGERQVYFAGVPLFRLPRWLSMKLTDKSKNKYVDEEKDEIAALADDDDAYALNWAKRLFKERGVKDSKGVKGLARDQFKAVIRRMIDESNLPSEEMLDGAFVSADTDKSGAIDREEFMVLVKTLLRAKGGSAMKLNAKEVSKKRRSFASFFGSSSSGSEETKGGGDDVESMVQGTGEQEEKGEEVHSPAEDPTAAASSEMVSNPLMAGDDEGGSGAAAESAAHDVWEAHVDVHSGRNYYHNTATGETRWHEDDDNDHHGQVAAEGTEAADAEADDLAADYAGYAGYAKHGAGGGGHYDTSGLAGSFDMLNPLRDDGAAPGGGGVEQAESNHSHYDNDNHAVNGSGVWEAHVDEASGRTYYHNTATGETRWDPPPDHAAGALGSY